MRSDGVGVSNQALEMGQFSLRTLLTGVAVAAFAVGMVRQFHEFGLVLLMVGVGAVLVLRRDDLHWADGRILGLGILLLGAMSMVFFRGYEGIHGELSQALLVRVVDAETGLPIPQAAIKFDSFNAAGREAGKTGTTGTLSLAVALPSFTRKYMLYSERELLPQTRYFRAAADGYDSELWSLGDWFPYAVPAKGDYPLSITVRLTRRGETKSAAKNFPHEQTAQVNDLHSPRTAPTTR